MQRVVKVIVKDVAEFFQSMRVGVVFFAGIEGIFSAIDDEKKMQVGSLEKRGEVESEFGS